MTVNGTILGVDFGTTNSVMAIPVGSEPRVILNREGERSTPSVVAWTPDNGWLVGQAALAQAHRSYADAFFSIKSKLGTGFSVERGGRRYYAYDLAAMILRKLREDAVMALGHDVRDVVVTHPVRFTWPRREDLILAYQLAGFRVVRMLPEPMAVALAYWAGTQERCQGAIYDLGGGSFDLAVIDAENDVIECLAIDGDERLGGDDLDRALAEYCLDRFEQDYGFTVRDDQTAYRRTLIEAEQATRGLVSASSVPFRVPHLVASNGTWFDLEMEITSQQYIELTAPFVQRWLGALCPRSEASKAGSEKPR